MQLPAVILDALFDAGYEKPTAIQASLVPLALQQYDLIGQAKTGSGKTAAFGLPILTHLSAGTNRKMPRALILVPTRELATQVSAEINKLGKGLGVRCLPIYGGVNIRTQQRDLDQGCDIVVATPGRIIDLSQRNSIDLSRLEIVVPDEADRMLDIGFRPDIEKILRRCPTERQTLLLSATLPDSILQLAKRYMIKPKLIELPQEDQKTQTIEQFYFSVAPEDKYRLLVALLQREQPSQAIVFCRTKIGTEKLFRKLEKTGDYDGVATLHGDMNQNGRERVMTRFRSGQIRLLIATDVIGRGIDVSSISHIINFDIPTLSEDYVHRVGRTGRMGREGIAYSFVTLDQGDELTGIELQINQLLKRDHIPGVSIESGQRTAGIEAKEVVVDKISEGLARRPKSRYRRW